MAWCSHTFFAGRIEAMAALPSHADIVIIGGGVVGCSVAYHLAKLGRTNVVLLERKRLTSGTTWHAAGLIGQLRATQNMTRLAKYSADLYESLEAETGVATGLKRNGGMIMALTPARFEELRRNASMARAFGVEVETLSANEAATMHPLLNPEGVVGGVYLPREGQADPANIAMALAAGARQRGVRILENVAVTGITRRNGHISGVSTADGDIGAEIVVNCAGMWGRAVGRMAGVHLPLQACEHFYAVTEPVAGLDRSLPSLRVPDECGYYKEDAGKILLGFFEPKAKPWSVDGIPADLEFAHLPDDMDHFAPFLETSTRRMPALQNTGIRMFFCGPESFTPDVRYLLGEAPEVRNFYVACGFNSVGIGSAGGAGKALSEWIVGSEPPFDLWDVDVRRTFPYQSTRSFIATRVSESLGLLYADHFPHRQFATARNVRHTPFHELLAARGACFGETAGWERAHWFVPEGVKPEYRAGWGRQDWFPYVRAEHQAVRTGVGMLDMSAFGKLRVEGRDAEAVLQRICANDVAVEPGRIVYTQWLNERGGIEADVTVTRLGERSFLVVSGPATVRRDHAWLERQMPVDANCSIVDVTSGEAVLAVMGPKSRALLQALTPDDVSNAAFPFGTARTIELGTTHVRAHRVTYVGELGWELYVPTEFARSLFTTLVEGGAAHGLRLVGMQAMDSLRLEKAYRHFGHDIGDEDHVLEAGLGFAVRADKSAGRFGDFIGRQAVLNRRAGGLSRRLVQFMLRDPEPLLYGTEPILRDGAVAGYLASGGYGHFLGAAVGLGYVPRRGGESDADLLGGSYEIEIAGQRTAARASLRPLYDPAGERVRG
jgi:4-methylaminobutanoate oxidase (formaldehyde-forming)